MPSAKVLSAPRAVNPWWVATVAGMASFIDAAVIVGTSTALVLYQEPLGVSPEQFGQFSALLTFSIAVGALVGGRLGDRFGRRHVFTATLIIVVLGAALSALAWDSWVLYLSLITIGLGAGADLPVSMAMVAESAPESKRGKMITFSHILWMLGMLSVMLIGIVVGGTGEAGARFIYGFIAVTSVVVIMLRFSLPESREWVKANDTRTASIALSDRRARRSDDIGALGHLFRSRFVVPLIALGLFYAIVNIAANTNGQFSTYLYVNVAGADVSTASAVSMISFAASLIGMLTLMRLVDTRYRMLGFAIGALLSLAGFAIPALMGVTVPALVAMGVLYSLGGAIAGEPMFKVWAQELFPTLFRSSAQGIMIAFTRVVAAIVALFTPGIIAFGPPVLFLFLIVTTLIAVIIGFFWVNRIPSAEGEAGVGGDGVAVNLDGKPETPGVLPAAEGASV